MQFLRRVQTGYMARPVQLIWLFFPGALKPISHRLMPTLRLS
jgi:hypothetical protein